MIVPNAVITTKTVCGEALLAFSMKAMPSSPGIFRSVRTTSGRELLELSERLEAVGRGLGRVALVAEDLAERGPRVGLVVDDEDAAARPRAPRDARAVSHPDEPLRSVGGASLPIAGRT